MGINIYMHILTSKEKSEGGSSKTIRKSISKAIINRTICDTSCPIWPCLLQHKVDPKTFKCVLNDLSLQKKNLFSKLFLSKEEGFNQVLLENAFLLGKQNQDADIFILMKIQESLINTKKAVYGSKKTVKIDRSQAIYEALQGTIIDVESNETNS